MSMWKAPRRPAREITEPYNDGLVTIYAVANIAEPGYRPVEDLTKKLTLRYEEQRLGIQRYYSGQQNQVEIERVIRTPRVANVSNQDVAITEDGRQHKIEMIQVVIDVYPPSMDITLARIEQDYEVLPDVVV